MIDFYHGSIKLLHCFSLRKKQVVLIHNTSVELHKKVLRLGKYSTSCCFENKGIPFVLVVKMTPFDFHAIYLKSPV